MERKKKKANIVILICVFFLFLFQASAFANLCHCLKQLKQRYSQQKGIVLVYERYIISTTMNMLGERKETDLAKGKMFFKPPYYIRIEQKIPDPEFVLCDGRWIWWYIPKKKVAHRYSLKGFSEEISILTDIFNGMKNLERDFVISAKDKFSFILKPKKSLHDVDKIEICVDKRCHRVVEVKIYNLLGSVTCFKIKEQLFKDIDKSLFTFTPADNVEIIQEK